jgi:excisionase family DNA binding protein
VSIQSTGLGHDDPLVVSPARARDMLGGIGKDTFYKLVDAGELESFMIGEIRRVTISSIKALIARRLKAGPRRRPPRTPQPAAGGGR